MHLEPEPIYKTSQIWNVDRVGFVNALFKYVDVLSSQTIQNQWNSYVQTVSKISPEFDNVEHSHWNWPAKVAWAKAAPSTPKTLGMYSLRGECQGLMMFHELHADDIEHGCPKLDLLEIKYIQVAPWNETRPQRPLTFPQQYKLVGPMMLKYAVAQSFEWGLAGRVGLESLDQALTWYKSKGFELVRGKRSNRDLDWLELSINGIKNYL
jgi:hypothetical protein